MKNTIVIGTQWGDEGKAKIVDFLASHHDIIVRFNGGANAGHTSEANINGEHVKFIFHVTPAGALYKDKMCVIGNGVVLDPFQLESEISELKQKDIHIEHRLIIGNNTHLVIPYHKDIDKHSDHKKGNKKLGTTGRGIGPAYSDKALRIGIRMEDALDEQRFREKIEKNVQQKDVAVDIDAIVKDYHAFAMKYQNSIQDISYYLSEQRRAGKSILFEGAQASFLDIDHGTYPYVTSSNASAGGACTGTGVGPRDIDRVVGVVKAYTTRVGEGPFVTELDDVSNTDTITYTDEYIAELSEKISSCSANSKENGIFIRWKGSEYGATTGRPRRCGWLDTVMLKKAVIVNSLDDIALTKLDVLDNMKEIKICTSYMINGKQTQQFPTDPAMLEHAEPVYETVPGWETDISNISTYDALPENTKKYIEKIEHILETPIQIISVGPRRDQTIICEKRH